MSARSPEAQAWSTGLDFLAELENLAVETVPRTATHAAYYAMFHAARAVLLKLEGSAAPTKHSVVVSRFGFHAKQSCDAALIEAAKALHHVRDDRLRSDYDTSEAPVPSDAALAIEEARALLGLCAHRYGFVAPVMKAG